MGEEKKRSLSEVTTDYVGERILQGGLAQKEEFVENDIIVELGISRGSMRDTPKQLMYEGSLDYETNKGYSVPMLSPKDAYEVFFLHDNLGDLVLRRYGGRLPSNGILPMEDAMLAMREAVAEDDMGKIIKYNEIFRKQILLSGQVECLTSLRGTLGPLNGVVFYTIKQVNECVSGIQADLDQEGIAVQAGRQGNNYLERKWLLEVLQRGNLGQSKSTINSHCVANGERIYRIGMRIENQELFYHV